MNGMLLWPSFVLDKGQDRVWSPGYFSEDEAKAADNIDGMHFWVKRNADGQPGDGSAKNFELIIGNAK